MSWLLVSLKFRWCCTICCSWTCASLFCISVPGCVKIHWERERELCAFVLCSIYYGATTDKLLPGQTLIFNQWIPLLANLIARWVMARRYERAPWAGEERGRWGADEGEEMSVGSGEASRWNVEEVDMEIRWGTNANHRWEQRKEEKKRK